MYQLDPYCGPTLPLGIMIWTKLNHPYLRMLLNDVHFFWPFGFWEEDFWKDTNIFKKVLIISVRTKVWLLCEFEFRSSKDALCKDWLISTKWVWRNRKSKNLQTDGQTARRRPDKMCSKKLFWAFSSGVEIPTTENRCWKEDAIL